MAIAALVLSLGILKYAHAQAQPAAPGSGLAPGARLRVTVAGRTGGGPSRLVGFLAGWDGGELRLTSGRSETRVLPQEAIERLERSASPSRRTRGALIGFAVGVAAVLGKAVAQGGCNDGCSSANVVEGLLVAAAAGTFGAIASPGEQWQDVAVSRSSGRAPVTREARSEVRLVPHLGRRTGLTVVVGF